MTINRRQCFGFLAAAAAAPVWGESRPPRTIALLFDSLVSPFWLAAIERMRQDARARGWSTLEAVSNMDDSRQFQQVESMIERRVDSIVIVHTDDKAVVPAIRAANAAGIPMVHFNRAPVSSDAYSVAVVADNRKLMDETVTGLIDLARRAGGKYRAAILMGDLGDANGVHRRDGFQDAVSRHPDVVEVVARIATEWNADKAFAGLTNALQAHPDINMLVTSSDFLTPQIEQALKAAGKWHPAGETDHVLTAGFDGDENGYRELEAGYYDVDGVQDLNLEVELTFHALEVMWAGGRPPKILTDPGFVISRATLVQERSRMWGYQAWQSKIRVQTQTSTPSSGSTSPAATLTAPKSVASRGTPSTTWWLGLIALAGIAQTLVSLKTLHDVFLALFPLAILAAGQLLVLLIGQIDLSMTAVMALSSVLSASLMTGQLAGPGGARATLEGSLAALAVGAGVGFFNGVCNARLRMPSFIVTLSVMMAGSGAAVWYASAVSETISIGGLPAAFRALGYGSIWNLPWALVMSVAVLAAIHYVLTRTVIGRWMYAIGHNRLAARISGVPVARVTIAAFTASGVCAALAGLIYTSRLETGLPTLGSNMLLDIVAAAVIGGVSLFGGRGSVWMTLGGALFLCILDKSLQLLGLSLFIVLAVKGIAILIAAGWDRMRHRPVTL